MAFNYGSSFSKGEELFFSDESRSPKSRVKSRASMTFRKNNTIVSEVSVIFWVEFESFWMEEEDSHEIRDGGGGGGMS